MDRFREAMHSPVLMNAVYWAFLLAVAAHVTPYVLLMLLVVPGFVSGDRVSVTEGSTTVDIESKSGSLDEAHVRQAVREARNDE